MSSLQRMVDLHGLFSPGRILVAEAIYLLVVLAVCLVVIRDTRDTAKTLAYLLLVIFLPGVGIAVYFAFGINYRKRKLYARKLDGDEHLRDRIGPHLSKATGHRLAADPQLAADAKALDQQPGQGPPAITADNDVRVLINGEEKFPALMEALEQARHHIHLEYYICEPGAVADGIKAVLMRKARAGVQVRFIYDDFGSRAIRGRWLKELRAAGVEAFPFNRVRLLLLANRLNYRNHRKVVVVDGRCAFMGGINLSDRYVNRPGDQRLHWRDTHVQVEGSGALFLQYLFLCDWNFCSGQSLAPSAAYFPAPAHRSLGTGMLVAASGPDSPLPTILLTLVRAITMARHEVLVTTPYFIPGDSIIDALRVAALSGVTVKLLVPGISDSGFVDAAARSYYGEVMEAGVEVYRYTKGFIHAKTVVVDDRIAIIGTANMDHRSFELNFEVNATFLGTGVATTLRRAFMHDIADAERIDATAWALRPFYKVMPERLARLVSPLL